MQEFRRGDLVFDVIDEGPADGPVVVLLHDFPEQHTMRRPVIDRLNLSVMTGAQTSPGISPNGFPTGSIL